MKKVILVIVTVVFVFLGGLFIYEKYFDKSYLPPEGAPGSVNKNLDDAR